ncbi:hypothetical protein SRB5_57600 [Streptomyces sp. RB5]|uniref:PLL-like beta propeller domain-containing protein n=1 Tax=Streptomyces smaragdinus TaxID=2585196 RepID=A0A7K0CQ34_9ACTN|nr:hypothetical protein [Streptomyces smaragdinus]MQY15577.1 hypothetical protein [Streptomyces smaragdinus]
MGRAQVREAMRRPGTSASAPPAATMLVAACPEDVRLLMSPELRSAPLVVVCLTAGDDRSREALRQGLAQWSGGGRWREERAARRAGLALPGIWLGLDGPARCEAWLLDAARGDEKAAVAALAAVCRETGPVLVRTHDPDPAHTAADEPEERGKAARLALEAARTYQRNSGNPTLVECVWAGHREAAGSSAGQRYPLPNNWLARGGDGRLSAYLPTAAGIVRWHESRPGSQEWVGPSLLSGPRLMPALTLVHGPGGYVHLIGLRRTKRKDGGADVAIVHATQYQTGRALAAWHSMGGPNAGDWRKARQMGVPSGALDAQGALHVFVRNVGHSISTLRQQANGALSAWEHLRGLRVSDEIKAATAPDGTIEVYARTRDAAAVVHWRQAGDSWQEDAQLPLSPIAGTLSVDAAGGWSGSAVARFDNSPGHEYCVWQSADHARSVGPGGVSLGVSAGRGGTSSVAGVFIGGWNSTVLARAGADGTPLVGAYPDGRPDSGIWWQPLGARSLVPPATATDASGRAVVAGMGTDGRLMIARQKPDADGLQFTPFEAVRDADRSER